jgi:hypothetical protein
VANDLQGVPAANGSTTDNYIPVWNNTSSEFENSVISDSGTLATLDTDADLLFPDSVQAQFGTGSDVDIYWDDGRSGLVIDGSASSPARSIFIEGGNGAGATIATIGDGSTAWMTFTNAVGNGSSLSYLDISANQDAIGGSNVQNMVNIRMETSYPNHSGGTMNGLRFQTFTQDAQATENAIYFQGGYDQEIMFSATAPKRISFAAGAGEELRIGSVDNGVYLDIQDHPDAGEDTGLSDALYHFVGIVNAMDFAAENTVFMRLDVVHGASTAGRNYALFIDDLPNSTNTLDYAIYQESGWDVALKATGINLADIHGSAANGSMTFCNDCDPNTTPCTAVGAQTGAFAFKVNSQWDCPW